MLKPTLKSRFLFVDMEKIKIILSCPQVIFREGIHFILSGEEDFDVTGETTDNLEALEIIEAGPPHVAVLSQSDTKSDIAEVTRRIKSTYPALAVVLITDIIDTEKLFSAVVSGVSATFMPDIDPEEMLEILRNVAMGRLPILEELLTPALASRALADFKDMATLDERLGISMASLSKRETEILDGLASGDTIGQVASAAGIADDIARNHLRAIVQKLVANDRNRRIIEKTQMTISSLMPSLNRNEGETREYLTRAEFNEFKHVLISGFRSLVGDKS